YGEQVALRDSRLGIKHAPHRYHRAIPSRPNTSRQPISTACGHTDECESRYAKNITASVVSRVTPWGDSPLPQGRYAISATPRREPGALSVSIHKGSPYSER